MITKVQRRILTCAILGFLVLSVTAPSLGQVVLSDNLNAQWPGPYPYGVEGSIVDAKTWSAQEFATDNQEYSLNSVTLGFRSDQGISPIPTLELKIFSDVAGKPGNMIGELTSPEMALGVPEFGTFTAQGIDLAPSTTYWAVLDSPDSIQSWVSWDATDGLVGDGVGFSTNECYSVDGGSTWIVSAPPPTPNIMEVVATPVPEPGTFHLLAAFGGVTAAAWGRNSRSPACGRERARRVS